MKKNYIGISANEKIEFISTNGQYEIFADRSYPELQVPNVPIRGRFILVKFKSIKPSDHLGIRHTMYICFSFTLGSL